MSRKYDLKAERDLLKRGTAAGPVTKEMIRRCKEKSREAERAGYGKGYWPDFLALVRAEIREEGKGNA